LVDTKGQSTQNTFYWNEKFQEIMELEESQNKYKRLRNLAHDFTHSASTYAESRVRVCAITFLRCSYGRIIISERFLPVLEKTIKPTSALGGTAGGLKYVCGGLRSAHLGWWQH
jgi:hypothetical protein